MRAKWFGKRRAKVGLQIAVKPIMSVYFEYQGRVSPNEYHYLVEVSKKDVDVSARSPEKLRIVASSILLNSLSVAPEGVLTPVEIEKTRFDEKAKEEIFRSTNGAIYRVIQETNA